MGDAFLVQNIKQASTITTIIQDGLQLYLDASNSTSYPGSGSTWFDISGNNRNATLTNASFSTNNGGVIVWSGNGPNRFTTSYTGFEGSNQSYTIGGWANVTSGTTPSSNWFLFGNYWGSSANAFYSLVTNDNGASSFFYIRDVNTANIIQTSSSNVPQNQWHYWVGVRNASTNQIHFYINGVLRASASFSGSFNTNNGAGYGGLSHSSNTSMRAQLGLTHVYNRALSTAEVLENFNATKSRFGL